MMIACREMALLRPTIVNCSALDNGEDYSNIREREIVNAVIDVGDRRLSEVERALRNLEEGSYVISDASGQPIPKARLQIVPERPRQSIRRRVRDSHSINLLRGPSCSSKLTVDVLASRQGFTGF